MMKKFTRPDKKVFCAIIFFLVFLHIGFFCLSINKISAVNLEVSYPPIGSSPALTAETKLPDYVKYLFDAGMFFGFIAVLISLTIAGVMYFLSPAKPDLLAEAKDRVSGAISGLLILVLTYLIITTINPQLSFFKLDELPTMTCNDNKECVTGGTGAPCTTNTDCAPKKTAGIYFYKSAGCSDNNIQPNVSNISDLGPLKNQINSVGIIQNLSSQTYYFTVLYDNPGLWGKCQFITTSDPNNPDGTCVPVDPFASSASIYPFDFYPNGEGIYFYRKSCFNSQATNNINVIENQCNKNSGGYYFISNQEIIDHISAGRPFNLDELCFTGNDSNPSACYNPDACTIPEGEQDCVRYDKDGTCICIEYDNNELCIKHATRCPTLAGENISSMIINGDYLVLLVYGVSDLMVYCQEFPTIDDVNKMGPQQIKWEHIRNSNGVIPNSISIIPIQR